jgi:hypothetical protein
METSERAAKMGAPVTAPEPAAKVGAHMTASEPTAKVAASEATPMPPAAMPPAPSRFRSGRKQAAGEGG